MATDIFVTGGKFSPNDPNGFNGYGLVAPSVNFLPPLHSYVVKVATDEVYEVIDILYSVNRTIVITVKQPNYSAKKIFDIPGEFPPHQPVDIFIGAPFSPNDPNGMNGYGFVAAVPFVPAIHSFYVNVDQDKVYEVLNLLFASDGSRTIALTALQGSSAKKIFNIPGAPPGPTSTSSRPGHS